MPCGEPIEYHTCGRNESISCKACVLENNRAEKERLEILHCSPASELLCSVIKVMKISSLEELYKRVSGLKEWWKEHQEIDKLKDNK